jgi:hypothetical protein
MPCTIFAQNEMMKCAMDGFNSSSSTTSPRYQEEDQSTGIEVYLLFKALHQNSYFPDRHISHHILLLKLRQQDNTFYYTDLDSSNFGKGRIKIVFGPYYFYPQKTIYYQPLGISRSRTLAEIKQFAEGSSLNGQNFSMFTQNCQHYVSSCIKFLGLDKSKLQSGDVYRVKEAQDMTLRPSSTVRVLPVTALVCRTVIFLCTLLFFKSFFRI